MNTPTFSNYTTVAIQAALQAGDILRKGFGTQFEIIFKPGHQNFVTEYDRLSESSIIGKIKKAFPDDCFLAEESGFSTPHALEKETVLWIIDPLDGTTNFARHLPLFTISIAAYRQEEGICGVIYQPMTNELFVAEKNRGAYLNGHPIHVSQTKHLEDCLITAGLPYVMDDLPLITIEKLLLLSRKGTTLRNFGSAALSLAYIAAGKADAFWMCNIFPWDVAAGKLLIEEAGGKLTKDDQSPISVQSPSTILASNKAIYQNLINYLASKHG